eukprot:1946531-Prymnesium_polylepis.2
MHLSFVGDGRAKDSGRTLQTFGRRCCMSRCVEPHAACARDALSAANTHTPRASRHRASRSSARCRLASHICGCPCNCPAGRRSPQAVYPRV